MFPTRYFCIRAFAPRYFPRPQAEEAAQVFSSVLVQAFSTAADWRFVEDEEILIL